MARMHWILPVVLFATCAAKGKKKDDEPVGPILGWHQEEGWKGACWYPPDWASLGTSDRRSQRATALQELIGQWRGDRNDGVSFDMPIIEGVETVLLGYPDKVEEVAAANLAQCQTAMKGGGTGAWAGWLAALPRKLTEGECARPLDDTLFWYLDIGVGWQGNAAVCDDDVVHVFASANDLYRIDEKGPWINAGGDPAKPARGSEYPCTLEDCLAGQLILRFRGQSGVEILKPVGLDLTFDPPEHGTIEFMINDTSYFNNVFKVDKGMQHHTSVTYEPVGN